MRRSRTAPSKTWSAALVELAIIALLLVWWAERALHGRFSIALPDAFRPLLLIAVFGVVQGIAPLATRGAADLSLDPEATRSAALLLLLLLGFGVLVATHFDDKKALQRLTAFLIVMGFCLAVFALVQAATWNGRIYWLRAVPAGAMPFGSFVNRNHFAGFMEMLHRFRSPCS